MPTWPHVVSIDPAASGNAGLLIAARDPKTGMWWIVVAKYLPGRAPSDQVEDVEKAARPYNIVRRIYDPHEAGFSKEATKEKLTYMGVYNKSQRKLELITNVQQAMQDGWLRFNKGMFDMFSELNDAEWNSDETGIRNSTKYHLLDALQYLIDNLPSKPKEIVTMNRDARIIKQAREQRIQESQAAKWGKAYDTRRRRTKWHRGKPMRPRVGI